MGLEELLALVLQVVDAPLPGASFLIGKLSLAGDLIEDEGLDLLEPIGGGLDGGVVILDKAFDAVDEHGLQGAVGALLLSTDADEVRVGRAVSVGGLGDDQTASAGSAGDRAVEVVWARGLRDALRDAGVVFAQQDYVTPDGPIVLGGLLGFEVALNEEE